MSKPVYTCEPSTEPGHSDISFSIPGASRHDVTAFWTMAPGGRVFVVYAKDVPTAVGRLFRGMPKSGFPHGSHAWELWDTPLPEGRLIADERRAPGT